MSARRVSKAQGDVVVSFDELRIQIRELENTAKKLRTSVGGHVKKLKKVISMGACICDMRKTHVKPTRRRPSASSP